MQTQPRVQWVTPSPLWGQAMSSPTEMQKPALLRFTADTFMDDLEALLQSKTRDLTPVKARPESFRARPIGAEANYISPAPTTLKLYQPAHGHFNLISASLVCRLAGLPDRHVEGATETVSFVVRRILTNGDEMAWVNDPVDGKGWKTVTQKKDLAAFEELNPMFPVGYTQDDHRRRLFAGLIPTSSSESYLPAPAAPDPAFTAALAAEGDPRMEEAETRVLQVLQANFFRVPPANISPDPKARTMLDNGQKEASLFLILDLAEILYTYLPTLWTNHIYAGSAPSGITLDLFNLLNTATVGGANTLTWRQALKTIWDERDDLMKGDPVTVSFNLKNAGGFSVNALRNSLKSALGPYTPPSVPPVSSVTPTASMRQLPKFDVGEDIHYIVRCVYQRPNCTPLIPPVLSAPTEEFIISNFFDPDAPARSIRIPMPLDTTIAGLRQFPKNVGIMLSDKLREQMASVTDLQKALDGELASGETFDLGVICSFSIPIITICALIVLLIFIALLNIVFWWMPLLRICLPIPLKAKA